MDIIIQPKSPKTSEVFATYWKFAAERQNIFFNRIHGNAIWTEDPIFHKHKFTNAYRASDRVSQYLIQHVIYSWDQTPKEVLFRILLFKTFNKIGTWEVLIKNLEEIRWDTYDFERYDRLLSNLMKQGRSIYSGAYIMTSGRGAFGFYKKHRNHLKLIEMMMQDNLTEKVLTVKSMEALFNLLKSYPTIGNFLAYQYATDINYSTLCDFDEMDFVFPGPGARDGIRKCFTSYGSYTEEGLIRYMAERQEEELANLELNFQNLWGRKLQLIDCQNLFCEVDKYARVAHPNVAGLSGRKRIKQIFKPTEEPINYWYPPDWKLNEKIYEDE